MIKYKIDVFEEMKKHGFTQARIQKEKLLPMQTVQNIKSGKSVTMDTLNKICLMCRCQPGDVLEEVASDEEKLKYFQKKRAAKQLFLI